MNKIIYILCSFILVALFTACDPITSSEGIGTVITSADQLAATVTPIMDGTLKTNKVRVHCTSPVNCQWTDGVKPYISNDTVMTLFVKGDITITLSAMAADGTILTKTFTTTVDEMKYSVEPQYGYFCGSGVKKWVWATDNTVDKASNRVWGNGGNTDSAPDWWGRTAADAASDNIDITGSMTFTLNGLKFARVENGVTTTGTFSFDMTVHKFPQCIGQVTFVGTTILHGISQNDGKKVVNVFNIIKLSNDELQLMYATDSNTYEGWFWLFKRDGYKY
jgi:hypothetical protein